AVVVADDRGSSRTHLIAHLVPADGRPLDVAGLQVALRQRVPEFMVPSAFVQVDRFPITSNGKVDRCALRAPDIGDSRTADDHLAPRTREEEEITGIWRRVLGVDT